MRAARCNYVQVVRFVRRLPGKSQPVLVEGIDGSYYLLKFGNNPLGPNVLFNEAAGAEIFQACRLSVPRWERLYISNSFLDRNRACWMDGANAIRPEPGLCFGTRYILQRQSRVYEILPASYHVRIRNRGDFWLAWILDLCCSKVGHREAIFVDRGSEMLEAVFIDSGDLFGGPRGEVQSSSLDSTYRDPRIYATLSEDELQSMLRVLRSVDVKRLRARASTLPLEWQTETAVAGFEKALNLIQTPLRVETIVEQLLQRHSPPISTETEGMTKDPRSLTSFLPSQSC